MYAVIVHIVGLSKLAVKINRTDRSINILDFMIFISLTIMLYLKYWQCYIKCQLKPFKRNYTLWLLSDLIGVNDASGDYLSDVHWRRIPINTLQLMLLALRSWDIHVSKRNSVRVLSCTCFLPHQPQRRNVILLRTPRTNINKISNMIRDSMPHTCLTGWPSSGNQSNCFDVFGSLLT